MEIELKQKEYNDYIYEHIENVDICYKLIRSKIEECPSIIRDYIYYTKSYADENVERVMNDSRFLNRYYAMCILEMCKDYNMAQYINSTLFTNIISHDISKFNPVEFDIYRKRFFPTEKEKGCDYNDLFEKAWNHHYTTNSHHPEYWVYKNDEVNDGYNSIPMDIISVLEMLCDWAAMSKKFSGNAKDWYYKNKTNKKEAIICLHDKTRELVEDLLDYFADIDYFGRTIE